VWLWEDNNGSYKPYSADVSLKLEQMDIGGTHSTTFGNSTYHITKIADDKAEQKNASTNYVRNAIRKSGSSSRHSSARKSNHFRQRDDYRHEEKTETPISSGASDVNIADIVEIKEERQIGKVVAKYRNFVMKEQRKYYEIDVSDAMYKLATCGTLIQLSYASTDGFKCQKDVAKLLSAYGTLVKDSYLAAAKFVVASITALEYHRLALKVIHKKASVSIKFVAKCSKLAKEMAVVAGNLSVKAGELTQLAEKALVNAVEDKSVSTKEREQIRKALAAAKAESERLTTLAKQTAAALEQVKQDEAKAIKDANAESKRAFVSDCVKTVCTGGVYVLTGKDKKKGGGKTAADRAFLLTKQKHEMQKNLIEQNANLAKSVSQLGSYRGTENRLQRALHSIEIAIKTLGKIKVIFANTKVFWEGVQANCNRLVTIGDNVEEYAIDAELFEDEIKASIIDSGVTWFVLCKVNYDAKQAIVQVDKGMDAILNDLPTESEAVKLVDELSRSMKKALKDENKKIQQAIQM